MTSVTIELPDSTLSALRQAPRQLAVEMRVAAAIHWYQQARMSMERAAECAGMTRAAFLAELARRKVDVFVVDQDDLRKKPARASARQTSLPETTGWGGIRRHAAVGLGVTSTLAMIGGSFGT